MLRKLYHLYVDKLIFHYFHFIMKRKLSKHQNMAKGKLLDIGSGDKPYKNLFKNVREYIGTNSADYYYGSLFQIPKNDLIVNDGTDLPCNNNEFDTVVNFQVLPVFKEPKEFFAEVKRVTKPNGIFFLTTDFMYPIWNAPFNFWRTTKYGLQHLAETTGWKVELVEAFGGYWVMQARMLERYFRNLLTTFITSFRNEKKSIPKLLKAIRILIWLLFVIVSPLLINPLLLLFHLLDKIGLDEDFTTNYLIILRKCDEISDSNN